MKKLITITLVLVMAMAFSNVNAADEWNTFSDNLIQALKSENDGLKASAMQLIIKHADRVWVHEAAYEVYKIYRNHENDKMRQLALVTLYKMQNPWFLESLEKELADEKSTAIRHQMMAILYGENEGENQLQVFYASN
jgi:hypothetical protein